MRTIASDRGTSGFTLVELLVSSVVAGLAVLVTLLLAGGMTIQLRTEHAGALAQDNARVAIDEITRTLRGAGSGIDYVNGQDRFVFAGPYTVALNANLTPTEDPDGGADPAALDPDLGASDVPLDAGQTYTPERSYGTGAETIVLSLDSNRDGTLTAADAADDEEEESQNPNDYVLKMFTYGSAAGQNAVTSTGLALLRGPATASGGDPEPLFRYWMDADNDPSTPSVLHGDLNGDGRLGSGEVGLLGPVASYQMALIERIDVAATAEPESPRGEAQYPATVLRSSASFRNRRSTAAHLVGRVFHDVDRDGALDADELGIRDVILQLNNGRKAKSNAEGWYSFVVTPALYTLTEVDPAGYTSTTANVVSVNPSPGDYVHVNFGDYSNLGTGKIVGTVFADEDEDGARDEDERGVQGVKIFLDTGSTTFTDVLGKYRFVVPAQDYTVTEEDSAGYVSTTPNVRQVNLRSPGDSVVVDFGDRKIDNSGRIHGVVYRDDDNDGQRDAGEPGIPNVTVTLDDDHTTATDEQGEFAFSTEPGVHQVRETDSAGYTSSTVNEVHVMVLAQQTVEVAFGDIAQQDIAFQEIVLGNTERALSISNLETGEDNRSDRDIVLGTHYVGGRNDVLVWWNNRTNASTPNSALFQTSASYQRVIAADVNSIGIADLNGDNRQDVVSALGSSTNNLAVWLVQGGGSSKGQLPTSPSALYTASLAASVNDVVVGTFDADASPDLAIGTRTGTNSGKVEIWHGAGNASFVRGANDILAVVPGVGAGWGEVVSIAAADFDGDGSSDLAVGTRTSPTLSAVYLLLYAPGEVSGSDFVLRTAFAVAGQLTDLLALDLFEDDLGDVDLVVATETASTAGRVEVWHNRGDNTFGAGDVPGVDPDDTADPGGSPLSLVAARLDNDIFPDVAVGTRNQSYSGKVVVYRAYGYLPAQGIVISASTVGEVITTTATDFNKDGAPDLAVGTRTSGTAGKVVIYFNQRPAL